MPFARGAPQHLFMWLAVLLLVGTLASLVTLRDRHYSPRVSVRFGPLVSPTVSPSSSAGAPATQAGPWPASAPRLGLTTPGSALAVQPQSSVSNSPQAADEALPSSLPPSPQRSATYEPAAPWTAPPGLLFPYHGLHQDLGTLLRTQANSQKWVTIISMSAGIKRFVLNCVYTLHKYGGWSYYILATFDKESLDACNALNLPCLDASSFANQSVGSGNHTYGSDMAKEIWWSKQRLALEVLRRGYNVHGCDADVVFFKDVQLSYQGVFDKTNADAIFGNEEWWHAWWMDWHFINYINAGVYAVRSNERTIKFFERWTADAVAGKGGVDQVKLNDLFLDAYMFCDSKLTCLAIQRLHKMSVFRHKSYYPGGVCTEDTLRPGACDSRRLYLHQLCGNGWDLKARRWDNLKLWFIDQDLKPMYADGGGPHGKHPFMPCKDKVAWDDLEVVKIGD